ncbi:hypothetical protein DITRI_Ditri12bG0174000 [Diplodiscus trichospermus]
MSPPPNLNVLGKSLKKHSTCSLLQLMNKLKSWPTDSRNLAVSICGVTKMASASLKRLMGCLLQGFFLEGLFVVLNHF